MQYSRKSINSLLIPDINVSVTSSWANGTIRFSSELIYDSESDIIISFLYFVIKSKYMYEGLNSSC